MIGGGKAPPPNTFFDERKFRDHMTDGNMLSDKLSRKQALLALVIVIAFIVVCFVIFFTLYPV